MEEENSMRYPIPTTIVSAYPACGKSTLAKLHPTQIRDLESSDYHWVISATGKVEHPQWPTCYIDTIRHLDRSGMYRAVMVSSHEAIRKAMHEAGIRYTNIVPENTPEMKELMLKRMKDRGNTPEFIQNQDENWSTYVESMINDPGASNVIQLTPKILNSWGDWIFLD